MILQTKQKVRRGGSEKVAVGLDYSSSFLVKHQQQASGNGEEASAAKLIEHGSNYLLISFYCISCMLKT